VNLLVTEIELDLSVGALFDYFFFSYKIDGFFNSFVSLFFGLLV